MAEFMNEKPFEHRCHNGTVFKGDRCDLRDTVHVHVQPTTSRDQLIRDYVEFTAWHCHCIWKQLNGFQGYDALHFEEILEIERPLNFTDTSQAICGVMVGEDEVIGMRCKDGGTCHHRCTNTCSRITSCAPLAGSMLDTDWGAHTEETVYNGIKEVNAGVYDHRGWTIIPKRDFAGHPWLIQGRWVDEGYIATKNGWNAIPGGVWFTSVADARRAIDVLFESGEG